MILQNELNILDLLTCVLLISFLTMRTIFPMFLDVTNFMANHSSYRLPPDLQIWGRENPKDVHHHFLLYVGSGGLHGGRSTGQNHELSTGRVLVKENGADILEKITSWRMSPQLRAWSMQEERAMSWSTFLLQLRSKLKAF